MPRRRVPDGGVLLFAHMRARGPWRPYRRSRRRRAGTPLRVALRSRSGGFIRPNVPSSSKSLAREEEVGASPRRSSRVAREVDSLRRTGVGSVDGGVVLGRHVAGPLDGFGLGLGRPERTPGVGVVALFRFFAKQRRVLGVDGDGSTRLGCFLSQRPRTGPRRCPYRPSNRRGTPRRGRTAAGRGVRQGSQSSVTPPLMP